MKVLKKLFLSVLVSCCALGLFVGFSSETAYAESLNSSVFNHITLTQEGNVLTYDNLLQYTDEDGTISTYIISNDSITVNFNPFEGYYIFDRDSLEDDERFSINETVYTFEKNYDTGDYLTQFSYNGTTYYFRLVDNGDNDVTVNIYQTNPTSEQQTVYISSQTGTVTSAGLIADSVAGRISGTSLIYGYNYDNYVEIHVINSITAYPSTFEDDTTARFEFTARLRTQSSSSTTSYVLEFMKPSIQFDNNKGSIVQFITNGDEDTADTLLPPEMNFQTLNLEFIQNNYSRINPLYFNINYNGFIYNFMMYVETYSGTDYLFVNYFEYVTDDSGATTVSVKEYLATELKEDGDSLVLGTNRYEEIYNFCMTFTKPGRYEIEFYDETYNLGLSNPNYYSTSFYIFEEPTTIDNAFNNIYIIAQLLDDNNDPLEYIVSNATLNSSVLVTIKNLDNLGDYSLEDVIDRIVVRTSSIGQAADVISETVYTIEDIQNNLLENDGDFKITLEDDNRYRILVYKKTTDGSTSSEYVSYAFSIVKKAKISYSDTDYGVELIEASEMYVTEVHTFSKYIVSTSPMTVIIKYRNTNTNDLIGDDSAKTLDISYYNEYTVSLGLPYASVTSSKTDTSITFTCLGIGDITVEVTYNGTTSTYLLNSEEGNSTITFEEQYGSYSVKITDSMGNQSSTTATLSKPINTSAIIFFVLIAVILLFIVIFILRARGRISTR